MSFACIGRALKAGALVAATAAIALAPRASAQTYPDRPVKIIVPIGPSGSYDIVGRLLADQLSRRLGGTFVVENRPGAGLIVGSQSVTTAPPDGSTLLVGGLANIIFNAGLYKKLPYDPIKDLVPVALVFNISYTMVGAKTLPYATVQEVIAAAKAKPDGLTMAHVGIGTGQHIFGTAFQKITGTKFLEVSYAAPPPRSRVIAGRVDLFLNSNAGRAAYVKGGQVKGLGMLARTRHPQMPDVPTMTRRRLRPRDQFMDRTVRTGRDAACRHRQAAGCDRGSVRRAQAAVRNRRRRADGGPRRQLQAPSCKASTTAGSR